MRFRLRTPPFQFTLRRMFIATFWSALWCWSVLADFKWQGSDGLMIAMIAFRIIGPFIAIGSLFGRTWIGALVGIVALTGFLVFAYVEIMNATTFP